MSGVRFQAPGAKRGAGGGSSADTGGRVWPAIVVGQVAEPAPLGAEADGRGVSPLS